MKKIPKHHSDNRVLSILYMYIYMSFFVKPFIDIFVILLHDLFELQCLDPYSVYDFVVSDSHYI